LGGRGFSKIFGVGGEKNHLTQKKKQLVVQFFRSPPKVLCVFRGLRGGGGGGVAQKKTGGGNHFFTLFFEFVRRGGDGGARAGGQFLPFFPGPLFMGVFNGGRGM